MSEPARPGSPSGRDEVAPGSGIGLAYARAGLLGNPSDSYGGKAIAFSVRNFAARVRVEPSDRLEIADRQAAPLLEAALGRFNAHTGGSRRGWRILLDTDIPFQVGLAGSSAIVIAALRGFAAASVRPLDPFDQSELALAAEVEDLGIAAGPMDRAIQAYEGVIRMDFSAPRSPASYTAMSSRSLPPLLIAWDPRGGKSSHVVHSDVRERWRSGDARVRSAMARLGELVDEGVAALDARDFERFRAAVDRNFDMRAELFEIADSDRRMVEIARKRRAAAKQCGSGGACVAVMAAESDARSLARAYREAGFETLRPIIDPG